MKTRHCIKGHSPDAKKKKKMRHHVRTIDLSMEQLVQVQQTGQKGDGLVAGEVSNDSSSVSDR